MEFKKVQNYLHFGERIKSHLEVEEIKITKISKMHYHYELFIKGLSLGVLCYNQGEITFSPFDLRNTKNSNMAGYIDSDWLPLFPYMAVIFERITTLADLLEK